MSALGKPISSIVILGQWRQLPGSARVRTLDTWECRIIANGSSEAMLTDTAQRTNVGFWVYPVSMPRFDILIHSHKILPLKVHRTPPPCPKRPRIFRYPLFQWFRRNHAFGAKAAKPAAKLEPRSQYAPLHSIAQ